MTIRRTRIPCPDEVEQSDYRFHAMWGTAEVAVPHNLSADQPVIETIVRPTVEVPSL